MRLIRRGGYYISGIRIDKPSPDRVIVPAVQLVQPRFGVIDIPTIAQGVCSAEGGGHAARYTSMCFSTRESSVAFCRLSVQAYIWSGRENLFR